MPVSDVLHVQLPDGRGAVRLDVLDAAGQRIHSRALRSWSSTVQVSTSALASGIYVLRLMQGDTVFTRAFMRQ